MKALSRILAIILLAASAALSVIVLMDDNLMARRDYIELEDDEEYL